MFGMKETSADTFYFILHLTEHFQLTSLNARYLKDLVRNLQRIQNAIVCQNLMTNSLQQGNI